MNQVAGLLHFWKCEVAVQMLTIAPGANDTGRTQDRNVLGGISLRQGEFALNIGEGAFASSKNGQNVQPFGMSEGLADHGLALEDLLVNRILLLPRHLVSDCRCLRHLSPVPASQLYFCM